MSLECCVISPVALTAHFPAVATNCPQALGDFLSKSLLWRTDCHGQGGVSGATVMAKAGRENFPLSRVFLTLVSHPH